MHRWSQLFIPTLREAPADAEVASHKFLLRAGYIRQLAAGIYSYLFLAQRSFNKISAIVRREMDGIGQEFCLPALHPREIWEASGRWRTMGDTLFRLQDRKGAELCLGMTEEEVMTEIARKELRSYKQLPQIWYQIQSKFRDEPRPRSGLLRVRQFLMKDSYSFDIDAPGLDASYNKHRDVYRRIFEACGLHYLIVDADSGAMGGTQSEEFMVRSPAGEDQIVSCGHCDYAANLEKATSSLPAVEELAPEADGAPLRAHSPAQKTIEDVARFFGTSPRSNIKTLALMAIEKDATGAPTSMRPVVVLLRGDHQMNEAKLSSALRGRETRPMEAEEIERFFGTPAGFLGPVGIAWAAELEDSGLPILLADSSLGGRANLIAGANEQDYHLKNVTPGRDFRPTVYADLRSVVAGEGCPRCGQPLRIDTAVEVGHIFKLGYKYSETMGARVLDQHGKEIIPIMGSYGIGIERILTAAIEQNHDQDGFFLDPTIAPFEVVVTPTNVRDQSLWTTALDIARGLDSAGFDVLLDDRDERPGVKFKDADLIGVPYRVTVGKKVTEGTIEVVPRSTRKVEDVSIADVAVYFSKVLRPSADAPQG